MVDLNKIIKVFDASFEPKNGKWHYNKHKRDKSLPSDMNKRQYYDKAEKVSLKTINGKSVRAYRIKVNGKWRTVKCDGNMLVVYADGKNGTLITAFPCSMSKWYSKMQRNKGEEILKE